MNIYQLAKSASRAEIDYLELMSLLRDYARPRDKVRRLLQSGELIRVKKGLYVLNPAITGTAYNRESLANLIFGPSVISLETALSFYGLIPERVEEIVSVTSKRRKVFDTPIGRFSYEYLHPTKFQVGIQQLQQDTSHYLLIASPEKALCDLLTLRTGICATDIAQMRVLLEEDLRIDLGRIKAMSMSRFHELAITYKSPLVTLLEQLRREL